MKILFVHQNFPGQFLHLAPALLRLGHEIAVLTDEVNKRETGLVTWRYHYKAPPIDAAATRLGRNYTVHSDRGVVVARAAKILRDKKDYRPDLIIGHSGWGETLFLKEVWPEAKLLTYAEFYYRGTGADVGFDPEFLKTGFDQQLLAQARAAHLGQALLHADRGLAPTLWQASTCPKPLRHMLEVIFDGIDTDRIQPNPQAALTLPNGRVLRAGDEVLSFVNRNLEPYRGYHIFMRALPEVMRARPEAQVVIIGGDEVSYGSAPAGLTGWKETILAEVRDQIDLSRVHFLGKVPYSDFIALMQITRVHAYLTYPFVLSWSMVEAMAAGALVVGSRTAPVEEMLTHGETGLLVDFFDVPGWSRQLIEALAHPEAYIHLRQAARQHVVTQYDLRRVCLPRQLALVDAMMTEPPGV